MGGCRESTVRGAAKVSAKAGPTPGYADWSATFDIGTNPAHIARALYIPSNICIGIYSDSVLCMYNASGNGKKGKRDLPWHRWPNYYLDEEAVMGGAAARQISERLPVEPYHIAREDVTMVFCMLNEVKGSLITGF